MTTAIERPATSLAACAEIAERLTSELGSSLRWLASFPGSGATLIIEGFVRDGELVLVADMPGGPGLDPWQDPTGRHEAPTGRHEAGWKESGARRPTCRSEAHRGLLRFSVALAPEGSVSGEKGRASALPHRSTPDVRES